MLEISQIFMNLLVRNLYLDFSPMFHSGLKYNFGLLVMEGDSCPEGSWFESLQCILDGHFSHNFLVKIVLFV